jgi:hypothetical protein
VKVITVDSGNRQYIHFQVIQIVVGQHKYAIYRGINPIITNGSNRVGYSQTGIMQNSSRTRSSKKVLLRTLGKPDANVAK